ncbi:TlpA family protein disulfide reductase [Bremerella volcania]|nr:TlpA disulfide reductase family protein [Bremerella volcania]
MKRFVVAACVSSSLFAFVACNRAADDAVPAAEAESTGGEVLAQDSLATFVANPTDTEPLMDFTNANFEALQKEMSGPSEVTQKHIEGIRKSIAGVDPGDNEQAAGLLNSIEKSLQVFEFRLVAKGFTLDEVQAKVTENPSDVEAIDLYAVKIDMVSSEMHDDIPQMEAFVKNEADFIVSNAEKVDDSKVKIAYRKAAIVLQSIAQDVDRLKSYEKIIGNEMTPIDAQAWVNGDGFTPEELEGKVILLDFWAVWCGPCVAGFPHMIEWQEEYGEEGLQVIGITRYFNFDWPEGAEGPGQVEDGEVPPAQEEAMLNKFVAEHGLKHPTALVADPDQFYESYAVSVIPHMVLIGRDGKIRKVVGGIGEAGIKSLDEAIQKALAEPAPQ